jgi:hypothetical protein
MISFISDPLNILVIIILCFVLFTSLGSYKEGYTEQGSTININGIQINNTLFTGKNGNTARILNNNGNYYIVVSYRSGNETLYTPTSSSTTTPSSTSTPSSTTTPSSTSSTVTTYDSPTSTNSTNNAYTQTTFSAPNGSTAEIISLNGYIILQITYSSGHVSTFTQESSSKTNTSSTSPPTYSSTSPPTYPPTYPPSYPPSYPPNYSSTSYPPTSYPPTYPPNYSTSYPPNYSTSYPPNYSSTSYPPSDYPNQASYPPSDYPNQASYPSTYNESEYNPYSQSNPNQSNINENDDYSSSLPPAIPTSQIPPGQEDLYILKSEIVPPVCPAPITACHQKTDNCAPCPPCGRCPEPNFECKKVPNYKSSNSDLPVPFLSPYSTFGS